MDFLISSSNAFLSLWAPPSGSLITESTIPKSSKSHGAGSVDLPAVHRDPREVRDPGRGTLDGAGPAQSRGGRRDRGDAEAGRRGTGPLSEPGGGQQRTRG